MLRKNAVVAAAILLLTAAALAQSSRHEASGGLSYSFTTRSTFQGPITTTENQQAVLKPSSGLGFRVAYQFHLTPRHGLEASYGYFRNTQGFKVSNTLTGLPLPSSSVKTSVQELTGAYVFHLKKITSRWSPFVEGGGGALFFGPTGNGDVTVGLSSQTRAVYLYGGGVDLKLSRSANVRLQYRGLLYDPPTFNVFTLAGFHSGSIAHIAQPAIALVYHF